MLIAFASSSTEQIWTKVGRLTSGALREPADPFRPETPLAS